ncbi:MAG TPA: NADP-dependent oxidoreductase [Thermodesulfobacteriota bacterium]
MKAAQINAYGGGEVVEINEVTQELTPSAGKVLVQVYAAGVNPVDWKIREGYLKERVSLQFPATLGGDFAGVVKKVGEGVTDFKEGDEVYGQAGLVNNGSGSFAELAVADINKIAPRPKMLNYVETASLPLAAVSAWQGIGEHIQAATGKKILIHGGAGGIGAFAIQIAKHLGAYVATTVSTADMQYAKELGADEVINYESQHFWDLAHDYDAVFDASGSGPETYEKSFEVVKRGGIVVSMTEQPNDELAQHYGVTTMRQSTDVTRQRLEKVAELVDQGVLKVEVDKVFPLEQAAEALTYLQTGHSKGKVVIKIK